MISYALKWTSYPDKPAHSAACSFFLLLPVDSFWNHRGGKGIWKPSENCSNRPSLRDKKPLSCRHGAGKVRKIPSPGCFSMLSPWNGSKPHRHYVRCLRDPQPMGPCSSVLLGPAACLHTSAHLGAVSRPAVVHAWTSVLLVQVCALGTGINQLV